MSTDTFHTLNQIENSVLSILHSKQLSQDGEAQSIMRNVVDSIEEFKEKEAIDSEQELLDEGAPAELADRCLSIT